MTRNLYLESGIAGVVLVVINLILYLIDPAMMASNMKGTGLGVIWLVLITIIGVRERKRQGNAMTYWRGFLVLLISSVIMAVIVTTWEVLLFHVIDPDLVDVVIREAQLNAVEMIQMFGAPDEAIEKTIEEFENADFKSRFSPGQQMLGVLTRTLFAGLFGFLLALIVRKHEPFNEALDGDF